MAARIVRGGVAAALLFLATAVAPTDARATSIPELSIEQYTDASTWIVEGKVTRVWTELDENDTARVWTRAELQVSEVHKGPQVVESLVIDSLGGTFGEITTYVPGSAVFSEGESVFLFLDRLGNDRLVPVGKFTGKLTLRRAPGERREFAMRWHAGRSERFDHRFLPHPPAHQRLYVNDLRERVQARLDRGWDGQPIPGLTEERLRTINELDRRIPR